MRRRLLCRRNVARSTGGQNRARRHHLFVGGDAAPRRGVGAKLRRASKVGHRGRRVIVCIVCGSAVPGVDARGGGADFINVVCRIGINGAIGGGGGQPRA